MGTFRSLDKKIINPHNESLGRLFSSAIGSSRFVYFKHVHLSEVAMTPSIENLEKRR